MNHLYNFFFIPVLAISIILHILKIIFYYSNQKFLNPLNQFQTDN